MRTYILRFVTHALPLMSIFLLLWLIRPEWMHSDSFLQSPPKAQFWRQYVEVAILIPISGFLIFIALITQTAKLSLVSLERNYAQYTWLAFLVLMAAYLAVPVINWLSNWMKFYGA